MTTKTSHTIAIPAGFEHHAAVYEPRSINGGIEPRYMIALPSVPELADCRLNNRGNHTASAPENRQPLILLNGTGDDDHQWRMLRMKAGDWRFPHDRLLTTCRIVARVTQFEARRVGPHGHNGNALHLDAIQFTPTERDDDGRLMCAALDEWIAERRGWFA